MMKRAYFAHHRQSKLAQKRKLFLSLEKKQWILQERSHIACRAPHKEGEKSRFSLFYDGCMIQTSNTPPQTLRCYVNSRHTEEECNSRYQTINFQDSQKINTFHSNSEPWPFQKKSLCDERQAKKHPHYAFQRFSCDMTTILCKVPIPRRRAAGWVQILISRVSCTIFSAKCALLLLEKGVGWHCLLLSYQIWPWNFVTSKK